MRIETYRHQLNKGWTAPLPSGSSASLVLVFGAPEYFDQSTPFKELTDAFPDACVVGCSSSGEIYEDEVFDGSLAVAALHFEDTTVRLAFADAATADSSHAAGEGLAEALNAADLRGVLVLSDGLSVNGTDLVRGLNEVLSPDVVVTGGLAGDGDRFERTWVLRDGQPVSGQISAVGLYGQSVRIGHGSKGGWDIFGPERVVTRSDGNVLYELDGRPALALYKEYLGELAGGLPATALLFPLAMRSEDSEPVVRTILSVDEDAQSMTFAGDLPEGNLVQLMRANFDRLVDGAAGASSAAGGGLSSAAGPVLSVAISCVGRRLVLGERTEEEVEATLEALPEGANQIGFYSYGELSPHASGACQLHNQTMTLTTISEAA